MIPQIIHYCWFGGKPKPQSVLKYIETWKKHCPDYQIKEWNESNFDYKKLRYTREAYACKKYAFVSDVTRLYALFKEGGIYLDTDVEVKKSFDPLLNHSSFLGYEDNLVGTGIIGACKGEKWIEELLKTYNNESFIFYTGKLNALPNPYRLNKLLKEQYGLIQDRRYCVLKDDIAVYPIDVLCAKIHETNTYCISDKTFSIHHFECSWKIHRDSILNKLLCCLKYIVIKLITK